MPKSACANQTFPQSIAALSFEVGSKDHIKPGGYHIGFSPSRYHLQPIHATTPRTSNPPSVSKIVSFAT